MLAYALKRLLALIPVLFGLTVIVFLIMALIPGDPATAILGSYATPENVEKLNRDLGLDRPIWEQYVIWLGNMLQGDFGRSYSLNRPVIDEVLERFGATLILAGAALILCTIFGLLIGIWTAARQYGWTDKILTFVVLIGISIPSFWLGLLLILLFAVHLRWLPASGMWAIYGGGDLPDLLTHLALPAFTLAVVATGVIARLTRSAMLEVLRQDFIRTARAKGVSERGVIYRPCLPRGPGLDHSCHRRAGGVRAGRGGLYRNRVPVAWHRADAGAGDLHPRQSCWCRAGSSWSPRRMSCSTCWPIWRKAGWTRGSRRDDPGPDPAQPAGGVRGRRAAGRVGRCLAGPRYCPWRTRI